MSGALGPVSNIQVEPIFNLPFQFQDLGRARISLGIEL
jgi:hypothetical protein